MQKQWRLAARPEGVPDRSHFELVEVPVPTLEPGKAVVKTLYLGVAPVMLRYMRNETDFESPLDLGSVMTGRGVAQVIESDCSDLPVGAVFGEMQRPVSRIAGVGAEDGDFALFPCDLFGIDADPDTLDGSSP